MELFLCALLVASSLLLMCVLLLPRAVVSTTTTSNNNNKRKKNKNRSHDIFETDKDSSLLPKTADVEWNENEEFEIVIEKVAARGKTPIESRILDRSCSKQYSESIQSLFKFEAVEATSRQLPAQSEGVPSPTESIRPLERTVSEPLPRSHQGANSTDLKLTRHLIYAVAESIGPKATQEDTHLLLIDKLPSQLKAQALLGVFDGHNGCFASAYLRDNLLSILSFEAQDDLSEVLRRALLKCEAGLYDAYSKSLELSSAGSTAIVALVREKEIYIANVGDSRAVISKNGIATELSTDHKPSVPNERDRILKSGGYLDSENYLNGEIGVARALGNFHLSNLKHPPDAKKPGPLIADPEISVLPISDDEEFLILASDGLWDIMSSQRAVQITRNALIKHGNIQLATQELLDASKVLETHDNTTIILFALKNLPLLPKKPKPRLKNKNSRLFAHIDKR